MLPNAQAFLLAVLVALTAGAMNGANVMYAAAAVLAAVILIAFGLSRLSLSRLQIALSAEGASCQAGQSMPITVRVRSIGNISLSSVGLELPHENLTLGKRCEYYPSVLLPPLRPGAEVEGKFLVPCLRRGRYLMGPTRLRDRDPIGMFESSRLLGEQIEVVVFPHLVDLPKLATWQMAPVAGRLPPSLRQGGPDEFSGIRQYNPGDDLRHVHWKVTAHTGVLVVKEYQTIFHDVISIHLDLREHNYQEGCESDALETAVSAAASVARAALAEHRMVALHGDGLSPVLAVPAVGKVRLRGIMLALAEVLANGQRSFTEALHSQLAQVPSGACVLVLTPSPDESVTVPLKHAVARGLSVRVLLVEERSLDSPAEEEKAEFIGALQRAGVGVPTLRWEDELPSALMASVPPRRLRREEMW